MLPSQSAGFGPDRYGESFADVYDDWYREASNAEATAHFIGRFGRGQRVLELGVGTGRLSAPIAAAGHQVVGVDASRSMLNRFLGTERSIAVEADMKALPLAATCLDTVLVATNTFFNLHTEAAQIACLEESRRVVRLGGRLIVEAMIPGDPDPRLDRLVTTRSIDVDRVVLTATIRDDTMQTITGQHIEITENRTRLRPWKVRYATPGQLDALCASAGFRLGDRFANWDADPLDAASNNAISVYVAI